MLTTLGPENRIWFCLRPTSLTRSFDGLSALVHNHLRSDPTNGDWYVFVNRRRMMMKSTHPVSTAAQEVRPRRGFPAASGTQREVRAGLRGQGLVPGRFPVPGQQLVHTGVRQPGDAREDISEPGLRIDVVELGGDDEGVHHRGSLTAAVGAGEQP